MKKTFSKIYCEILKKIDKKSKIIAYIISFLIGFGFIFLYSRLIKKSPNIFIILSIYTLICAFFYPVVSTIFNINLFNKQKMSKKEFGKVFFGLERIIPYHLGPFIYIYYSINQKKYLETIKEYEKNNKILIYL